MQLADHKNTAEDKVRMDRARQKLRSLCFDQFDMSRIATERPRRDTKRVSYNETAMWNKMTKKQDSSSDSDTPPRKQNQRRRGKTSSSETTPYESEAEYYYSEEEYYEEEDNEEEELPAKRRSKPVKWSSDDDEPVKKPAPKRKPPPKKAKPVVEEYEYEYEEEDEPDTVQNILGMKDPDAEDTTTDEDDTTTSHEKQYYVKFHGKSYMHCKYMTKSEILALDGGDGALSRFAKKEKNLTSSLSIPSLLAVDETAINSDWFEIDRILDDTNEDGKQEYLVKWKSQEYCDATWEKEDDIEDKTKIEEYYRRLEHSNPTKIPPRWKRPGSNAYTELTEPPKSKDGLAELREYQLEGLNWLRFSWYNGRNTILADEMGLGKTAQTVSMLNYLAEAHKITGPFLVVAPLSTLPQWKYEFERWTNLNAVIFHGTKESRDIIVNTEFNVLDDHGRIRENRIQADVVITNYDIFRSDYKTMANIQWRYLIADEGHKLKNHEGKIYGLMKGLSFEACTLLTGTPIQNNMSEMWSLLHFISPDKFDDHDGFMEVYGDVKDKEKVDGIRELMKPYMMRRKKADVEKAILPKEETIIEVELTMIQKKFYRAFLDDNRDTLLKQITGSSTISLQNLMMQLRKVCNHPFLIRDAEKGIIKEMRNEPQYEHMSRKQLKKDALVSSSGKMILIDKLLPKLRADGHKVLIFSQMVKILDLIEQYLLLRGYTYERIDGGCSETKRQAAIDRFKVEDRFVFLLSTKAGGVGINLTAADTVIIFDSDWNPQNDIQAQARCHRIGQTATVKVYRLITRGTYESEMFKRASMKLGLDHVVLDGGEVNKNDQMKAEDIEKMLRNGAYSLFNEDDTQFEQFAKDDIEQILERRAKHYKEDIVAGGGSIFAKASFIVNEGENNVELDSKNFWQSVLGERQLNNSGETLVRRCREQNSILDMTEIRRVMKDLIDRGLNAEDMNELAVLKIALSLSKPDDRVALVAIQQQMRGQRIYDDEEEEQFEDEDIDPMKVFGCDKTLAVEPRAETIVQRVAFFARLERVLFFVQEQGIEWPLQPVWADPCTEYAFMVGIDKYGFSDLSMTYDDPDLPLSSAEQLSRPQLEKKIMSRIEQIEKQFNARPLKIPKNFEPAPPLAWKKSHSDLLARSTLAEHEFMSLLQTITNIGFPIRGDGSVDWNKIKSCSANLSSVSIEAVQSIGEKLRQFLTEEKEEEEQKEQKEQKEETESEDEGSAELKIDLEKFPELEGLVGVKHEIIRKMKSTISDMTTIYDFVQNASAKKWEIARDAPKNEHLPSWWGPDEDKALILAISTYGIFPVTSWMIDPSFPFRKHIPAEHMEAVEKMAAQEKKKFFQRGVKPPKELEDFSYVTKERPRVYRALSVIDFVRKNMKKRHGKSSKGKATEYAIKTPRLKVITLGEPQPDLRYQDKYLPIGYTIERLFKPKEVPEASLVWYLASITLVDGVPVFSAKTRDDESINVAAVDLIEFWKLFYEALGVPVPTKGLSKSVLQFFGFLQSEVKEAIDALTKDFPVEEKSRLPKSKSLKSQMVPFKIKVPEIPAGVLKLVEDGQKKQRQTKIQPIPPAMPILTPNPQ